MFWLTIKIIKYTTPVFTNMVLISQYVVDHLITDTKFIMQHSEGRDFTTPAFVRNQEAVAILISTVFSERHCKLEVHVDLCI